MIDSGKVFLLSETNTRNIFELTGNLLLLPARLLWNGHTVKIGHVRDNPTVDMHYQRKCGEVDDLVGKLVNVIAMIVFIVPGILLKGLAFLSPNVRARHASVLQSLSTNPELPKGFTLNFEKDHHNKICTRNATLKLDCSGADESDLETFIGKKLLELKPHLSLSEGIWNLDFGDRKFETLDLNKKIKAGSEETTLDVILLSRCLRNTVFGRCLDPGNLYAVCSIGNDYLIDAAC